MKIFEYLILFNDCWSGAHCETCPRVIGAGALFLKNLTVTRFRARKGDHTHFLQLLDFIEVWGR